MPYIGTSPSNGVRRVFDYTATAGQTSFSGSDNNSQTLAYTDSAYIDVYQNGILLIPSDYTATTGTTVVLDTGATVSDTVQIVAYDVFSVADTVSASDGGSFGGNVGVGGTLSVTGATTSGGFIPSEISLPSAGTPTIFRRNTDGNLYIQGADVSGTDKGIILLDGGQNTMINAQPTTLTLNTSNAVALNIDANGHITKPKQPAFLVEPSNNAANQNIAVGSDVTVAFGTEIFDQNGDFASNTFTAPVTGKYQLQTGLRVQSLSYSINYYFVLIKTSNRSYINILDPDFGQDSSYFTFTLSVLADMDANDTAIVTIYQPTGTQQTDIIDDSFFSGYLVC
jgi:hypothetical protein